MNGLLQALRSSISLEARVADAESQRAREQSCLAQTLARLLREMAQERLHLRNIPGVFPECMIVGNGFRLGVDQEFIGVARAGFAKEGRAPLSEYFFQLFLLVRGELLDGFDSQRAQGPFCNFTNPGNFSDRQWGQEQGFPSR